MPKWMLSRALTLAGALGVPISGASAATQDDTTPFSSAAEARAYLLENPTGPDASAAISALTEIQTNSFDESQDTVRVAQSTGGAASGVLQSQPSSSADSDTGGGQY